MNTYIPTHLVRPRGALLAVLSLAVLVSSGAAADDPEAERATFEVAPGFDVSLFASEKDGVVKPIQIRFDARGRLWVIGSTVYPQIEPGQKPDDKVLILEDTDHDGRVDKTTVFADGLMIPTGLELAQGGAYVGHGTELLFLPDENHDDRADERRVVLRGFGTGDNHQNINSFTWGPSGELWMSQGLHTRSSIETPWGIVRLEQAGLWRLRPRRLQLEGFYGSEHEPQNPWGFVFTDWGEPIVLAGNNSSAIYPVPGLVSRHRDEAPALIWKNGNGRKVSGGEIVGNKHFPDDWQGALIAGGYINNAVWTLKIRDDGAGFSLEDLPPLIRTTNRVFRPVDVKFGPDGALYVCDWYNPIIGHYQASFRHPDRDKTHGRIWRVTAHGRPLTTPPNLANAPIADLARALSSPDRWTRQFAKRLLADAPGHDVATVIDSFWRQPSTSEHARKEALGVFASHEIIAPELLENLAHAQDPGARAYAASVAGLWADRLSDPLRLLGALVTDSNPRVRLQAIVASSYVSQPQTVSVTLRAAEMPSDPFLDYALKQAVFALKPFWLEPFQKGGLTFENRLPRLTAFVRADGTPDTLQTVRQLLQSPSLNREARRSFLHVLADLGTAGDLESILLLSDSSLQAELLPVVLESASVRKIRPSGDVAALLRPLIQNRGPQRGDALRLAGVWKVGSFLDTARSAALSSEEPVSVREFALASLSSFGGPEAVGTLEKATEDSSEAIQARALTALAVLDTARAAEIAVRKLEQFQNESRMAEVFAALLHRELGARALAVAFSKKSPSRRVAESGLRIMNSTGRRPADLADLLTRAAGARIEAKPTEPDAVKAFAAEVRQSGDFQKGKNLFFRADLGCVICHAVSGEGGTLGPNLSTLGTAQPIDFIVKAILDPQKEVKEGYNSISVTTKEGDDFQGYLLRQSNEELVLRDVAQNQEIRIRRDAIKQRKQIGSIMPPGLVDSLSRTEFRDLVRFLSEQGTHRN